jgi:hypothetical protein
MQVPWSALAADDLERICEWIERNNPEAARRVGKTIYDGWGQLHRLENLNRCAAETSRRSLGRQELTVSEGGKTEPLVRLTFDIPENVHRRIKDHSCPKGHQAHGDRMRFFESRHKNHYTGQKKKPSGSESFTSN